MSDVIDRILGSLRSLTQAFTARLPLAFVWRYSVSEVSETSFSGRRLSPLCPFDDMPNIPLMPGIAGAGIKPKVGSTVGICFLDGDPSRPTVVCWDQNVPVSVTIDASEKIRVGPSVAAIELAGSGKPAVHRVGDKGTAGTVEVSPSDAAGTGLKFTNADGSSYVVSITFVGGAVVVGPGVPPGPFNLVTHATTGSGKVTSG